MNQVERELVKSFEAARRQRRNNESRRFEQFMACTLLTDRQFISKAGAIIKRIGDELAAIKKSELGVHEINFILPQTDMTAANTRKEKAGQDDIRKLAYDALRCTYETRKHKNYLNLERDVDTILPSIWERAVESVENKMRKKRCHSLNIISQDGQRTTSYKTLLSRPKQQPVLLASARDCELGFPSGIEYVC